MKYSVVLVAITSFVILFSSDVHAAQSRQTQVINEEDLGAGENTIVSIADLKQLTSQERRQEEKLLRQEKTLERKKQKVSNLLNKLYTRASTGDSSGVGLALVIVLVGAALALLGFVGIADLLISIGLVVLVVGLVIWLITAIAG
ncbi:MAG TPA: hypothetical protein VI603_02770 [Saprospiraceae bacterium]|nr:hypothetical protein [Saprospiraceae bacterium]